MFKKKAEPLTESQLAQPEHSEYLEGPVGQAHVAFNRGDRLFQFSGDVSKQQTVLIAGARGMTTKKTTDPNEVLNAICDRGWDLVNASFVFMHEGSESRDKLLSSGQQLAVRGRTVGYYLFRRCESNRKAVDDAQAEGAATV